MSDVKDSELRQRVDLIERMLAEGRHGCEYYGWIFLLWGIGHASAMAWSALMPLPQKSLPWAILMPICGLLMILIGRIKGRRRRVRTVIGRAVGMVWLAATPTFFLAGGLSSHASAAGLEAFAGFFLLIGIPNVASGLILRWPVQVTVGVLWWLAAIAAMIRPTPEVIMGAFAAMILIGEILFGLYLMAKERKELAGA